MAEQTIRVNVPDGYAVVRVGVPNNGELILSGGEVIVSPPTVYDRVIVRKVDVESQPKPYSTICLCGHSKSQHNGKDRACDYIGYACDCDHYQRAQNHS